MNEQIKHSWSKLWNPAYGFLLRTDQNTREPIDKTETKGTYGM